MLASSVANIPGPIEISEINMQKVEDFRRNAKNSKYDLPLYIGIVRDKNGQLKYIDARNYIIKHMASDPQHLKKGTFYQIIKEPVLSLENVCDFNQLFDKYDHFVKIILASYDNLPDEVRAQSRYYAGLMAEEKNDHVSSCNWFQLSADAGHCMALYRLGLLSQNPENNLPLCSSEYFSFARDLADPDSKEMELIEEALDPKILPKLIKYGPSKE